MTFFSRHLTTLESTWGRSCNLCFTCGAAGCIPGRARGLWLAVFLTKTSMAHKPSNRDWSFPTHLWIDVSQLGLGSYFQERMVPILHLLKVFFLHPKTDIQQVQLKPPRFERKYCKHVSRHRFFGIYYLFVKFWGCTYFVAYFFICLGNQT